MPPKKKEKETLTICVLKLSEVIDMVLSDKERDKICVYCKKINKNGVLNGDDIELITGALKEFNGDNGDVSE